MAQTPRWGLRYPVLSDSADVPRDMGYLAADLDNVAMDSQGLISARPVSTPGSPGKYGRYYFATDEGILYRDHGTGWNSVGALADRSVTSIKIALDAILEEHIADGSVQSGQIATNAVTSAKVADGAIGSAKIGTDLKPSQGAGSAVEALRALGTSAGQAAAGQHKTQHAPGGVDAIDYSQVHLRGTLAARPAASTTNQGLLYFATDEDGGTLYLSRGVAGWEKISPALSFHPVGMISPFAGAAAPNGWLMCDGAAVSRTTYATLFALISTTYGTGDGSTTFNVPDLRGRVAVGKGTHADVSALSVSDGLAVGSRSVKHWHDIAGTLLKNVGSPWSIVTGSGGWNGEDIYAGDNSKPAEAPAFLVINYVIKH
jgi:hypothetical protein